jgi:hypothetical protein
MENNSMKIVILLLFFAEVRTLVAADLYLGDDPDSGAAHIPPSLTVMPRSESITIPGRTPLINDVRYERELRRIFTAYKSSYLGKKMLKEDFQELLKEASPKWIKEKLNPIMDTLPAIYPVQLEVIELLKEYVAAYFLTEESGEGGESDGECG